MRKIDKLVQYGWEGGCRGTHVDYFNRKLRIGRLKINELTGGKVTGEKGRASGKLEFF